MKLFKKIRRHEDLLAEHEMRISCLEQIILEQRKKVKKEAKKAKAKK